jgi:hypothetical protein
MFRDAQAQPISIMHVTLHPSPLFEFPSSQASAPCKFPFPQPEEQDDLPLISLHDQPRATVQFQLHPS